ncbi:MAG: GNAT family N-acetyltransferase [Fusobacterium sp.]|nr:GNAT family N-acetyltransferase [Fusobacterium sp.]
MNEISLRNLEKKDIRIIYEHIHLSYVKKYFSENLEEQWNIYKKWYEYMIEAPQYKLYFFENKDKDFISFINYEIKNNRAIVNIYINQKYRAQNYGKYLLDMSMEKLKEDTKNIKYVVAYILEENLISQKLFLKANFNFKKIERYNKIKYKLYRRYL